MVISTWIKHKIQAIKNVSTALYTLDIFAHNIVIKRYLDEKTFFHQYFFPVCIENIFWDNSKYFEMSLLYFEEKKYHFITISQYCDQKCLLCNGIYLDVSFGF